MRSSNLLQKEWCDTVFANRNKAYGAYWLREQTGRRYRYALTAVIGFFLLLVLAGGCWALYIHFIIAQDMKDAEDIFAKKPSDLKEGYKVKFLATARQAPTVRMAPGAKSSTPEIVDGLPPLQTIGEDGPIDYDPDEQLIVTPIVDTTNIHDETLPIAKEKIVPTEMVSQMPGFPGGIRAFMKWMDEHIVYPSRCIKNNLQGSITLTFIVGTDGYTTDWEVKNAFDTEVYRTAIRALKQMPKWTPGTDDQGQPTPVRITLPVDFKLN